MKYIESPSNDAYFNMALEEFVFEEMPRDDSYFMLWQNENAIVVGKYQNTIEEINPDYVRDHNISVVRRLSGGGAMYQDMGNLNFTFIVDQDTAKSLDFGIFIKPVVHALAQIGVKAEFNSRNDIVIDGRKFSGNSQYNKKGRTMHHGTLLFDSHLEVVQQALQVKADKIQSKGIKSVRSRVTNILEHMENKITLPEFKEILLTHMFDANSLTRYDLTEEDLAKIQKLREEKYATWEWNYGRSPAYNIKKERRYDFGNIEILMETEKGGTISSIEFYGDFFGNGDIGDLAGKLVGCHLQKEEILAALQDIDVGYYVSGSDADTIADLILY